MKTEIDQKRHRGLGGGLEGGSKYSYAISFWEPKETKNRCIGQHRSFVPLDLVQNDKQRHSI